MRISLFEVISRIYKIASHSIHNEKQIEALYNQNTPLFESLPETRCSVNAILKGKSMYRSSHPPLWRMKCKQKGSGGRVVKIVTTATNFEPARYNVNMYHAGNMLQTNASKHANRSKSYHAYTKIAFHSIHNEKQIEALYNHRTPLFESLPETRCSVNAILKGKSMYRSSHPPKWKTGSDEAPKSPKKEVQGTTEQRLTWKIWESERESRRHAAQNALEDAQTKGLANVNVDVHQ